jgi:hypothetical protein
LLPLVASLTLARQEALPGASATPSCGACDAFNSEAGFFSVVDDCQNYEYSTFIDDEYWSSNVSWVRQNMPHCLLALTSSLGVARPSSFVRSDVPIASFMEQFGVIVGRSATAAGAYAYDAAFWGESKGGEENQLALCVNESEHARGRIELLGRVCAETPYPSWREMREAFMLTPLNCRFSSLEAMARAHREYSDLESNLTSACMTDLPRIHLPHNQVQLRYGMDDVLGVIAKAPRQLPHAARFTQWLAELTGRRLDTVLLTADGCRCLDRDNERAEAGQSEMPVVPYEQPPRAESAACADSPVIPCPVACTAPPMNLLRRASTSHVWFVRTPLTDGNLVACATRDWERMGWWTTIGLGRTALERPTQCATPCRGTRQVLVITVRNPYAYWWRRYQAFVSCGGGEGRNCTTPADAAASSHRKTLLSAPKLPSFDTFLQVETKLPGISQSEYIQRLCGNPCRYDFVLRAEALETDWIALLAQLSFPLRRLPLTDESVPDDPAELAEHYTPELVNLVQAVEAFVFEHFKYPLGRFNT